MSDNLTFGASHALSPLSLIQKNNCGVITSVSDCSTEEKKHIYNSTADEHSCHSRVTNVDPRLLSYLVMFFSHLSPVYLSPTETFCREYILSQQHWGILGEVKCEIVWSWPNCSFDMRFDMLCGPCHPAIGAFARELCPSGV